MTRRVLVLLVILLAIAAAFLLGRRGPAPTQVEVEPVTRRAVLRATVTASGEIVPTRYADIGSSVMGKVVELRVAEGDRVSAGEVVARIDPVQARSEAAAAAAQVRAFQADEAAAAQQARAADAAIEAAEARAVEARKSLARARELRDRGVLSAAELDQAQAAADTAEATLRSTQADAGRARETGTAVTRRIEQAAAQRTRAQDLLAKTDIVAPMDGVVTRLNVRQGEMVVIGIQNQPGTTLMTISDLAAINAEVKVAEADVLRLRTGQAADITLEALPGRSFRGEVIEIGASALPQAGAAAAAREFRVVVRLADPDAALRPGLTCDAEIVTAERSSALALPLQAVVLRPAADGRGDRPGVFVVRDDVARFTEVTTGIIGGLDIEIAGVEEGTPAVIGPFQALRELQDGAPVRYDRRRRD
jgi:HlyD family secretion protein